MLERISAFFLVLMFRLFLQLPPVREQEYEKAPTLRRRAEKTDPAAAPEFRRYAHLCASARRRKAHPGQDPENSAARQVRGGANAHEQLPGLPGTACYPALLVILPQCDEGMSGLPYRARRQLGQVYR
jgi:hypothetical protein